MATARRRRITNLKAGSTGDPVGSYKELYSVDIGPAKGKCLGADRLTPGLYPVHILDDTETNDSYVKIHFIGWSKKYDRLIEDKLEPFIETENNPQALEDLGVLIKEHLTVGTKIDRFVCLRITLVEKDFEILRDVAVVHKVTRSRTTYTISSRFMVTKIFKKTWGLRCVECRRGQLLC